jgi:aldehyde dehydrogenase (NAD+)
MADVLAPPKRPPFANYLAGRWQPGLSGATYEKRNPAAPSNVVGSFPASGAADVEAAVAAARSASRAWSSLPAAARGELLGRVALAIEARAEQIAQDMTLEVGKPIRESRLEAARAAQVFRFFAGETWRPRGELYEQATGSALYTLRRPVGVVALIAPWNFPLAIPSWKAAPALAFGNTAVLKLAQEAPLTGLHLAACLQEAGLPDGVCNVLVGRGAEIGDPLIAHEDVRAISFTGSVPVGEHIRELAAWNAKAAQLELGGHNPLVVLGDADLDRAVEAAYAGAFWSAGQKCTATRRILVQEAVYDDFRERLLARVAAGRVGDPSDPETEVGPLVNEGALEDVLSAVERGRNEGGVVAAGGARGPGAGFLVEPTVFEDVGESAYLSCVEVFGPVTSLYRYGTLDEALERANAVPFGLSASIFTRDLHTVQRFSEELQAGILHVNSQTAGADVHVPFGGIKGSGFGPHEQGRAALEFYTDAVTVYQDAPLA